MYYIIWLSYDTDTGGYRSWRLVKHEPEPDDTYTQFTTREEAITWLEDNGLIMPEGM